MEQTMKIACILCGKLFEIEKSPDGKPVGARICDSCWQCPKCGVGVCVDIDGVEYYDQGLIEEDAGIYCYVCNRGWTAKALERALLKKKNRVKCPHCKGAGYVDGGNKS